jgi:hypothetical protein
VRRDDKTGAVNPKSKGELFIVLHNSVIKESNNIT